LNNEFHKDFFGQRPISQSPALQTRASGSANGTMNTDVQVDNYNASLEAIVYQNGANGRPFKPVNLSSSGTNSSPYFAFQSNSGSNFLNNGIICDEHGVNLGSNQFVAPYPEDIAQLYRQVLVDTTTQPFDAQRHWINRYAIYRNLEVDDTLRKVDTVLAAFYDSVSISNLGKLHRSLQALNEDEKSITARGQFRDTLSAITPSVEPESAFRDILVLMIDILEDTNTRTNPSLDSLLYNLSDSIFELDTIRQKDWGLDSIRKQALIEIANLCPFEYGIGVYMARNVLAVLDTNNIVYSDSCGISGGVFRLEDQGNTSANNQAYIGIPYPNPSKENYYLNYAIGKEDVLIVEVFDILGRPIIRKTLDYEKSQSIFELNETDGLYLYRIVLNQKPVQNGKLILIR